MTTATLPEPIAPISGDYNVTSSIGAGLKDALSPKVWLVALTPAIIATLLTIPIGFALVPLVAPIVTDLAQSLVTQFFATWEMPQFIKTFIQWLMGPVILHGLITVITLIGAWLGVMFGVQGVITMPLIVKHVAQKHYPQLEKRGAGQWWPSVANGVLVSVCLFVVWILALPLLLIPLVNLAILACLLAITLYLTQRFDALVDHATPAERKQVWDLAGTDLKIIAGCYGGLGLIPLSWLILPAFSGLAMTHCSLRALGVIRRQTQATQ